MLKKAKTVKNVNAYTIWNSLAGGIQHQSNSQEHDELTAMDHSMIIVALTSLISINFKR